MDLHNGPLEAPPFLGRELSILGIENIQGLGAALMHIILGKGHYGLRAFEALQGIKHRSSGEARVIAQGIPIGTQELSHGLEHGLVVLRRHSGHLRERFHVQVC